MDKESQNWTAEEQELFERYLLDEMEAQEKADFESQLLADPDFHAQFLAFKKVFRAIEEAGLRSKLADFHDFGQKDGRKGSMFSRSSRAFYRFAAALAIILALGGLWLLATPNEHENLYREYYAPDPGLPTVMGNSANYDFYEAMVDYKRGNYKLALKKWEKLRRESGENDTLNYFLGSAYLAEGEAARAIPFFDRVLKANGGTFESEAAFYKGLAHLKIHEIKEARKYLEQSDQEKGQALARKLKD